MSPYCGKVPYSTPSSAWQAIRNLSHSLALISHKRLHQRNRVYHCPLCNAWHLTHQRLPKRPPWIDPLHTLQRLNLQRLMLEAAEVQP